ncbi:hypothetical protein SAMN05443637_115179 [Pseudonocardia thermophila]|jgi:hypothetical protein|uniref:Uncharacterized protein n=1 Tax=Pseudonocardia thermophila TaxID=1848 RepID=A0A1M6WYG8_PSETH|nr:hypothetical protein [Pseudonocardia thermophila]SHK98714.1 hypothetical protein SAMN05443637_115179 [Pseudonocardia thermophila]
MSVAFVREEGKLTTEFDYLRDRQVSKLLDLVLQLATEVHVSRQRERALEALLVRHGVLKAGEVDQFRPSEDEAQVLDREKNGLTNRLIRIITEDGPAEHPLRRQWEDALNSKAE